MPKLAITTMIEARNKPPEGNIHTNERTCSTTKQNHSATLCVNTTVLYKHTCAVTISSYPFIELTFYTFTPNVHNRTRF